MKFDFGRRPIAASSCGAGFVALVFASSFGWTRQFDAAVLFSLRAPGNLADPLGAPWFEEAARDLTALGGTPVLTLGVLVFALYMAVRGQGRAAAFAVVIMSIAQLASEALKAIYHRPRPELVPHEVAVYSASMPSGHAMLAATAFFSIAFALSERVALKSARAAIVGVAAVLTFLVGASRVYLGVHWPTDVIAGWLAGIALASLASGAYPRGRHTSSRGA